MTTLTSRPRRNRVLIWVALAAIVALSAWINLPTFGRVFSRSAVRVATLPAAGPLVGAGQRLLLLSPHPDDESLCCGGILQQARAAGGQVYVAWITPGDGFELDGVLTEHALRPRGASMRNLGQQRLAEARAAAGVLGIPADHTFMLGYPDGGLLRLYTTNYVTPYTSVHTGASAVYVRGALTPGAPYTGQALEADLRRVLDRVKPDVVLVPAPQDFHTDHHTLSYIALRLMAERGQSDRLRFWVIHGGLEWPLPKGLHPGLPLTVPPLATRLPWERVDLTPQEEEVKRRAMDAHRSQTRILGRFMHAFVRGNELVSPQPLPGPAGEAAATEPPGPDFSPVP
ncbi:PIG-L deacetylase family protein [Deinococcus sp. Leaf326]|uniref:PIG-L deacetylase family protein n=1 Tax=Deinococcus sp. Leaf326 TaxID=1736338 RepID=UPI000AAE71D9|nr:PIG-L deacetylase family protein [Deinococcus sp. Leaf326]